MLRNVFSKTLWDQRRGILGWSLGIAAVGVLYAAFYPSMANPDVPVASLPTGPYGRPGSAGRSCSAGSLKSTRFEVDPLRSSPRRWARQVRHFRPAR
jgi:hypothetical protein